MTIEERAKVAEHIFRIVAEFGEHPWKINCGSCEDFANELIEALGEEAEMSWPEDLPGGEDYVIRHVLVSFRGWFFDAEEPFGVQNWKDIPLCARAIRNSYLDAFEPQE